MMLWVKVASRLLFFLELLVAAGLFRWKLPQRKKWWVRLLGCLAVVVGATILYVLLKDAMMDRLTVDSLAPSYFLAVVYELLSITLCGVTAHQIFDISAATATFVSAVVFSMQSIADNILSLLLWGPSQGSFTVRDLAQPLYLLAFLAVYGVVYGLCYRLFIRNYEDQGEDPLTHRVMLIVIGISMINIILGGVEAPRESPQASRLFLFMLIARLLLGLLSLVVLFYLLKWARLQFEFEKQEYIMQLQRQQYEVAKESVNMVNINAHDLRNQINVIKEAIRASGKSDMIREELSEMERYVDSVDTDYHTGNGALDIVLTEKSRLCRDKSIQFSAIVDGAALERVSDVDVYVFFGNALDNAIEAVEELEDPEDRIISLSLRREPSGVVIHVENTFATPPRFEDGIPQTHKEGPFHGYGTKSMRSVAEKYGGNLRMHTDSEVFLMDCYIP